MRWLLLLMLLLYGCVPIIPPNPTPTPEPTINPTPEITPTATPEATPEPSPTPEPSIEPTPIEPLNVNLSGLINSSYCEFLIQPQIKAFCADWSVRSWEPTNESFPFLWANYGWTYEGWPDLIENSSSFYYMANVTCEYGNWRIGTFKERFLWNFSKNQLLNLSISGFNGSGYLNFWHWCLNRADFERIWGSLMRSPIEAIGSRSK